MADRIVAMNGGVAQQVGTPLELYDNPANVFVAGFIGSPAMNFLPARIAPADDGAEVWLSNALLARTARPTVAPAGGEVTLGLRPERVNLVRQGEGVPARVLLVEPTGASTIVHLESGPHQLKLFTTERQPLASGEEVFFRVEPDDIRLFDPQSGVRLR